MPLFLPYPTLPLSIANGGTGGSTAKDAARLSSGIYVLAQSAVQVPLTGTTSPTTLATITVPGNSMTANGRLRITTTWSYTNSVNNKTMSVRFGGAGGTLYQNFVATTSAAYRDQVEIANRNATNSQVGIPNGLSGGFTTSTGTMATSALDTTANQDILIQGTLALGTETLNLESYLVEIIAGAGT